MSSPVDSSIQSQQAGDGRGFRHSGTLVSCHRIDVPISFQKWELLELVCAYGGGILHCLFVDRLNVDGWSIVSPACDVMKGSRDVRFCNVRREAEDRNWSMRPGLIKDLQGTT